MPHNKLCPKIVSRFPTSSNVPNIGGRLDGGPPLPSLGLASLEFFNINVITHGVLPIIIGMHLLRKLQINCSQLSIRGIGRNAAVGHVTKHVLARPTTQINHALGTLGLETRRQG